MQYLWSSPCHSKYRKLKNNQWKIRLDARNSMRRNHYHNGHNGRCKMGRNNWKSAVTMKNRKLKRNHGNRRNIKWEIFSLWRWRERQKQLERLSLSQWATENAMAITETIWHLYERQPLSLWASENLIAILEYKKQLRYFGWQKTRKSSVEQWTGTI